MLWLGVFALLFLHVFLALGLAGCRGVDMEGKRMRGLLPLRMGPLSFLTALPLSGFVVSSRLCIRKIAFSYFTVGVVAM